ncbi:methylated-DNA--[protein]-cysteine S-methyltransferase [Candidatus Omnitrophota bacterium]
MKKRQRLSITTSANTEFEKKVYQEVAKIPRGETRSYKWVAKAIGYPKAYRAVGNALNKNPFIGMVPCHRVIKSDGSLGGFAKGAKAKKRLLAKEGVKLGP